MYSVFGYLRIICFHFSNPCIIWFKWFKILQPQNSKKRFKKYSGGNGRGENEENQNIKACQVKWKKNGGKAGELPCCVIAASACSYPKRQTGSDVFSDSSEPVALLCVWVFLIYYLWRIFTPFAQNPLTIPFSGYLQFSSWKNAPIIHCEIRINHVPYSHFFSTQQIIAS